MYFIAIDLGSTNIKVGVYNRYLDCLGIESVQVEYFRSKEIVEFDAQTYVDTIFSLIATLVKQAKISTDDSVQIILTGQAESLVLLDAEGNCLGNAISWMDGRSHKESQLIEKEFGLELFYKKTGQQAVSPTWPSTKILWLRHHRPEQFAKVAQFVLFKDYVSYRISGKLVTDLSVATFSCYCDIFEKKYWREMLDFIGITVEQLPPLVEPGSIIGTLADEAQQACGLGKHTTVNIGTLDHFAGMVGSGCVEQGVASFSTGTVMALATIASSKSYHNSGIAMHYGFQPDSYIMLPVAESGGASLQWFRDNFLPKVGFAQIDQEITRRGAFNEIIFLPYLMGTNAPEMDAHASGVFWNLRYQHDPYDMAYAVMEGVAHLLKKICDAIINSNTPITKIFATGGGAKSTLWCQLQADITGLPVIVPKQEEAALLGAAIIGAVSVGLYDSYTIEGVNTEIVRSYEPRDDHRLTLKHRQFNYLYESSLSVPRA